MWFKRLDLSHISVRCVNFVYVIIYISHLCGFFFMLTTLGKVIAEDLTTQVRYWNQWHMSEVKISRIIFLTLFKNYMILFQKKLEQLQSKLVDLNMGIATESSSKSAVLNNIRFVTQLKNFFLLEIILAIYQWNRYVEQLDH